MLIAQASPAPASSGLAAAHRPVLLHITADHPDSINAAKTKAVSSLLAASPWAEHLVYSLNRVAWPAAVTPFAPSEAGGVFCARYLGLPFGLGLSHWMANVASDIEAQLRESGVRPGLIHAHKLTFEGIAAERLSERLQLPYVLTVRGHTDHRVIAAKPLLRSRFRRIVRKARQVFFLAPWSHARLEAQLGISIPHARMLPNICARMAAPDDDARPQSRFVSLFHFRNHRVKNIERVFLALHRLRGEGAEVTLDVIGAGDDAELTMMRTLAQRSGVSEWVRCLRAMSHEELRPALADYAALVLPSYPETFGMVYIEALSAGLPVIYARNSGIDGYIDEELIATAVDHRDIGAIVAAMRSVLERKDDARRRVLEFCAAGGLDIFSAASAAETYRTVISASLGPDHAS